MTTTITVCSRILFLTGLLALAGCGQGQNDGSDTASAPAAEAGDQTATAEQPASSTQTESASDQTDMAADDSGTSESAAADSGADTSGGESHTVKARATSYDPVVLQINPGDNVNWTNMSGHNVNFEKGNIPAEAEPWRTPISKGVNRTFEHEGLYLYKCDPHFSLGMVGALIVGEPDNVAEVEENAKGMYKRALAKAMKQIE